MIWVLNIDVAIGAIRTAFNPLSCSIELHDYQNQIRLRVFGPDNKPVLGIVTISTRDVVDLSLLRTELQRARALVATKGVRLRAWTIPSWGDKSPAGFNPRG